MIILAPLGSEPLPWGHEIYNFDRGLSGLQNYVFSFPYKCVVVEKIIFTIICINTIQPFWLAIESNIFEKLAFLLP